MYERLLLAEDDKETAHLMARMLAEDFQAVDVCYDGQEAWEHLLAVRPSLLITDWSMPRMNGMDLCRKIQNSAQYHGMPIIMVTSHTDVTEVVLGLELGVDDYMKKPIDLHELRARVHALLRRIHDEDTNERQEKRLCHGDLCVDEIQAECFVDGQNLNLTKIEYDMLRLLMGAPHKTFSRNEILDRVWDEDYMGDPRTVDVYIRHLRSKLEEIHPDKQYIKTIRGRGWHLV